MVKIKRLLYRILRFIRRKTNRIQIILVSTFNHQHAQYLYDLVRSKYSTHINKLYRFNLHMELNNGDIIYFMTNNPQKIKGRRVNKLIIYEKLLQDDIIYVHDALIPCLRDCTTENVFTIPDRHEEKIIDILRQL